MTPDSREVTLLIVDDEVPILNSLRRCLRREGYRILTAASPAKALVLLQDNRVDIILSDHKMPGMDGIDLLEEVRRQQPGAVRLLISGWSETIPRDRLDALELLAVLPKPWDDAALKSALREAAGKIPASAS